MYTFRAGIVGAALLAAAAQANAGSVDAKLLDMLLANGSITGAQHAELTADLKAEQQAQAVAQDQRVEQDQRIVALTEAREQDKAQFDAFQKMAGWAAGTALKGDMRVRHDRIDIQGEPKYATVPPGGSVPIVRDKDRQRIRARLGAFTQVNPEVETGIQIATGNSADRRSTNQDLDGSFDKKSVWLDLGYIDYHPVQVPGLDLVAGKMKQPWLAVADVAWDGDINPEGFAGRYTRSYGSTNLFGSAGYFVLQDNVDGDGVEFKNDLSLYAFQAGVTFDANDRLRMTLGASVNDFSGDGQRLAIGSALLPLIASGNTTDKFKLYEGFGQVDVAGLAVPLTVYGQYVLNADSRDYKTFQDADEDTAWLLGVRTNIAGVALEYNYRDVERNAVVGYFTDSDFASGYTASSGHKLKAQYDMLKNFSVALTWFLAESDAASRYRSPADVETLMLDLSAKF